MYNFNKKWLQTKPLRDRLKAVQAIVEKKMSDLAEKKRALEAIN